MITHLLLQKFTSLVSYAFQHIPAGVGQVRDVVSQAENYTDRHQLHQSSIPPLPHIHILNAQCYYKSLYALQGADAAQLSMSVFNEPACN